MSVVELVDGVEERAPADVRTCRTVDGRVMPPRMARTAAQLCRLVERTQALCEQVRELQVESEVLVHAMVDQAGRDFGPLCSECAGTGWMPGLDNGGGPCPCLA